MLADVGYWTLRIDAWQNAYDATTAAAVQPFDTRGCFSRADDVRGRLALRTGLNAFWKEEDVRCKS